MKYQKELLIVAGLVVVYYLYTNKEHLSNNIYAQIGDIAGYVSAALIVIILISVIFGGAR
jgi:hypothetical protein